MTAPALPLEITEPGVYADVPEGAYHRHPALSSSGARKLIPPNCPARYRWDTDHPEPPNQVYDVGRAAHRLVLGVGAPLHVVEADDYRTKAARDERDAAHEDGLTPLLLAEYEQVTAMAKALREHPIAGRLFAPGRGEPEQSLYWVDRSTGVMCRARLDWLTHRTGRRLVIPDYKTAFSAAPAVFERAFYQHGYHVQAAWYLGGVRALGLDTEPAFVFVAQEKTPPYLVTVFEPDAAALRAGAIDARLALQVFAHCTEAGEWPTYVDGIAPLSLPPWAERQYAREGVL